MHTYTNIEKQMLIALRDQNITDIMYLGAAIKEVYFCSRQCALLMEPASKKAKLFYPLGEKHADKKCFASLVSLVTFLDHLVDEGLIYLQPTLMNHEVLFYQNFDHSFLLGGERPAPDVKHVITHQEFIRYDLSPTPTTIKGPSGLTIPARQLQSETLFITDAEGNRYMASTDVSSLYDKLYGLLCSRAYPTESLRRFIENGYCTDDERRNKISLWLSQASFFVALLALILTSPLVTTCYTNEHGYSTIEQHQFDTLKTLISKPQVPDTCIKKDGYEIVLKSDESQKEIETTDTIK